MMIVVALLCNLITELIERSRLFALYRAAKTRAVMRLELQIEIFIQAVYEILSGRGNRMAHHMSDGHFEATLDAPGLVQAAKDHLAAVGAKVARAEGAVLSR